MKGYVGVAVTALLLALPAGAAAQADIGPGPLRAVTTACANVL